MINIFKASVKELINFGNFADDNMMYRIGNLVIFEWGFVPGGEWHVLDQDKPGKVPCAMFRFWSHRAGEFRRISSPPIGLS